MYQFVDTIEASAGAGRPAEALKINGAYIEDLVDGYRTLTVSGREALSPELSHFETGIRDGSKLKSKRYPARIIIVTYQLSATSSQAFRTSYNRLAAILDVENAELIFDDEPDKFFIGTPSAINEVEPGMNTVVGEIEFTCGDPLKYSVIEYEATTSLDSSSILIDYNGTYKAYPRLEAAFYSESDVKADGTTAGTLTGSGDCGYVAFFTEAEKIIQLGDPDEVDGSNAYARSQTLANQAFEGSGSWGTAAQGLWTQNAGTVIPGDVQQTGSVAMAVASYTTASAPTSTSGTLLTVTSYANQPRINYTVTARTSGRTASSVIVSVAITAALATSSNYFGRGYSLKAHLYIGGAWREVTLKNTNDYWRGNSGHTVNLTVTVSGLNNSTTALTGIKFKATRPDGLGTAGALGETNCNNLAISIYEISVPETYYLAASSYGTGNGIWHGPSITRTLPADDAGEVGAKDFTLTYSQKMCLANSSSTKQVGGFHANVVTADGIVVAGVRIVKHLYGSNLASLRLYIRGNLVHQTDIDLSYYNPYFGAGGSAVRTSTITKSGGAITFNVGGYSRTFNDAAAASLAAVKVTLVFEAYSTTATLAYNGLYWVKFVKNNCETWKDIPNKFSADDVVEADCKTGQVLLNGVPTPELGALGNDWEGFFLTPGLNQIGVAYSDWVDVTHAPAFTVRYREAFL